MRELGVIRCLCGCRLVAVLLISSWAIFFRNLLELRGSQRGRQICDLRLLPNTVKESCRTAFDRGSNAAHRRRHRLFGICGRLCGRGESRPALRICLALAAKRFVGPLFHAIGHFVQALDGRLRLVVSKGVAAIRNGALGLLGISANEG